MSEGDKRRASREAHQQGGLEETPPLTCRLSYRCIRCHRWAGTRPFPSTCNRGGTCSSSCLVCWCSSPAGHRCSSHSGTRCHLRRQKNASDFDKQGKMELLVKRRGQEANSQNLLCPNGRVWHSMKKLCLSILLCTADKVGMWTIFFLESKAPTLQCFRQPRAIVLAACCAFHLQTKQPMTDS